MVGSWPDCSAARIKSHVIRTKHEVYDAYGLEDPCFFWGGGGGFWGGII